MTFTPLTLITIVALGAVTVILFMGLWTMFKGGAGSGNRSQMLMRARVIAQAIAVAAILAALFFFGRS
ncbi:twin transmembrane helix small protein [Devosia sp.]|uniref:twin transmembrane helix small protein n=1 Tax=Devosia sp. TaxID=1871048 RepID=UPI002EF2419A